MDPLIPAAELQRLLADGPSRHLVVLDVSYQLGRPGWGWQQFRDGHVPGAAFVDVDEELSDPVAAGGTGGRHPLPSAERFAAAMRRAGVREESLVVCYDQRTSLSAARCWWLLRHFGHQDVRVLDGGMAAWRAAGGEVETQQQERPEGSFRAEAGQLSVVDAEQVVALMQQGHQLYDVRAAERYRGETEPIDPVAGHVPGARNLPATTLQDDQGRFLPVDELRELVAQVHPGDAVSCGSGITAMQALLGLERAGVPGVAVYAGSWSDWISDPRRAVETAL